MFAALARPVRAVALRAAPEVNANHWLDRMLGRIDPDAPSPDRQRNSYAGLVWRLAQTRANFAARAFLDAVVQQQQGAQAELAAVPASHPWARLLARPHPTTPPLLFWTWVQLAKDFGSGAALVVERDAAGAPLYLHPVYPEFGTMRPVGAPDGTIAHFVYQPNGVARATEYPTSSVIWIHHPHPVTPYESASMIEVAASAIDARRYAEVYQATQAKSGGYPAAYASGDFGSQDVADSFSSRFAARYLPDPDTGRVARRFPVLPTDVKILPLSIAPVDMRAIETMGLTASDLKYLFLGTEAMGSADATYSNSTQATRDFVQFVGQPEADANAAMLSAGLDDVYATPIARRGTVVVTVPDLMPLDPEERRKERTHRLASGLTSIDEVRAEDGAKPWGGDAARPMVSGLLQPLSIAGDPPPTPPTPRESAPAPREEEADDEAASPETSRTAPTRDADADGSDGDPLAAEWRMVDGRKRKAETPMRAVAAGYIRSVGEGVAAKIAALPALRSVDTRRAPDAGDVLALVFDLDAWLTELETTLGPAAVAAIRAGFETGAIRLPTDLGGDLAFDATRPGVKRALARSLSRAGSVPETLRADVGRAIAAGLEAGETGAEIAARVRAHVDGLADWQAERIARTTGAQAFEAGQQEAWTSAGVGKNRWLTQRDNVVRAEHAGLDGEEVDVGAAFSNGSTQPEDPNCRCTLLPVIPAGDRAALSPRDAYIVAEYPALRDRKGREAALTMLRDAIAERVEDGWTPIGERQILRIAKGHAA